MALFKSVPAVSTQKDTMGPMNKKPEAVITDEDLEMKKPLSEAEEDKILSEKIKPLPPEDLPDPVIDDDEPLLEDEPKKEAKPKPKAEEPKKEAKSEPKAEAPKKEAKPEPKAEEPKKEAKPEPKAEEPKKEAKSEPKAEAPKEEPKEPEKVMTPEEAKKARMMANLEKARLARQAQQERESGNMAEKNDKATPKKPAPKPKKAVDMSKMVMAAPKKASSTKTVYHVSKRGETLDDRVWKVFIQESDKVIKLFDYQEEALAYAKQLAKNKGDGSYVILHGLNGKIRKF